MSDEGGEDQRLRGGLPITGGAMIRAIIHHCGEMWLTTVEQRSKAEFAKKGFFDYQLRDSNVLFDVVPMPDPWRGEWGYRIKTAYIEASGDVHVCEYYLPSSEIAQARSGLPQGVVIN